MLYLYENWERDTDFISHLWICLCFYFILFLVCTFFCLKCLNWTVWPSVISVVQILMSALYTGHAVSPVPTLKAPTHAPAWRATCLSQTTAPARPRMVSTSRQLIETVQMFCSYSSCSLIVMSTLLSSASRPPACPVDRQLPEHPSHLPERHHTAQPVVH